MTLCPEKRPCDEGISPAMEIVPILGRVRSHARTPDKSAIVESGPHTAAPKTITFAALLSNVEEVSLVVAGILAGRPEGTKHVAFLVNPSIAYVVAELSIWAAGAACVPLSVHSPAPELDYFCRDCEASLAIADASSDSKLRPVADNLGVACAVISETETAGTGGIPRFVLQAAPGMATGKGEVDAAIKNPALILYTSGTTGQPKGAVHTFVSLTAQMESLSEAWQWSSNDYTLHVLPLHHIHGVQNILNTAIFNGATVEFTPFDAGHCLTRLGSGEVTCFHAVPTVYVKFTQYLEKLDDEARSAICKGLRNESLRYMVSGSAALPVPTMTSWAKISGHVLLERYGMTEIGMALSNRVDATRYPGCVGWPLPKVEVKLDEDGSGGILVRGPTVFGEYYKREEATKKEFTEDGWFRTGDNAQLGGGAEELQQLQDAAREVEEATGCIRPGTTATADPSLATIYRIMGRSSVDIIKSGGYKISALEIESALLQHEKIRECAVVGKPDETWGEKVTAVCVLDGDLTLEELRKWAKERLASYKVPQELDVVMELPRNQMGKLEKKKVLERYRK